MKGEQSALLSRMASCRCVEGYVRPTDAELAAYDGAAFTGSSYSARGRGEGGGCGGCTRRRRGRHICACGPRRRESWHAPATTHPQCIQPIRCRHTPMRSTCIGEFVKQTGLLQLSLSRQRTAVHNLLPMRAGAFACRCIPWDLRPRVRCGRQVELMKRTFDCGVSAFGSCWGIQVPNLSRPPLFWSLSSDALGLTFLTSSCVAHHLIGPPRTTTCPTHLVIMSDRGSGTGGRGGAQPERP